MTNEELLLAQDIFQYVIRSLQFDKEDDIALAITALDKSSLEELKSLSKNNTGAKQALGIIEDYFGHIEYPKDSNQSSYKDVIKGIEDYSTIKPEKLENHLENFEHSWDQKEYLVQWAKYWLNKENTDKKEIYQTLTKIIEKDGVKNTAGEVLDILYPLAYELDNEIAFEYLCWAQANNNGWYSYWTDKKQAEKRWDFVKEFYPERYMDFFEKSIVYSGKMYGRDRGYFISIPRGVEFLALFENLEAMEEITESGVKFTDFLMGNLELPNSKWIDLNDIDEIDILLNRLIWPSPLVRERAVVGIARLLQFSPNKENIFERLLNWIKNQNLESIVAIGLLPILKATEKKEEFVPEYININKLVNALPVTSIVIERLIEELARLLNKEVNYTANRVRIDEAPSDYSPGEFFNKSITGFLAPVYLYRANEIIHKTGKDFIKQWAYISQKLREECGLEERYNNPMEFMGGNHSPILSGMSTFMSEVYRSAFLRTLQHFFDENLISIDSYLAHSYATLPVELSYWKFKPSRAPKWWPKLKYNASKEGDSALKFKCQNDIEEIIHTKEDFLILGIDGAIQPTDGWSNGVLNHSITLVAFGYKFKGQNTPTAEEVATEILYSPLISVIPSKVSLPLNFLESYSEHIPEETTQIEIGDLIIYPLIARNRYLVISLFQWFRGYHLPFTLYSELVDGLYIKLEDDRWSYMKDYQRISSSQDWLEGLKEREDKDLEIPHGNYIEADSSFVTSYLAKRDLKLGYVLKISHKYKEHNYDEVKLIESYELIGVNGS